MIDRQQIEKKVQDKKLRDRWSFIIFILLVVACSIIHYYQVHHAPSGAPATEQVSQRPAHGGNTLPGSNKPAAANRPEK